MLRPRFHAHFRRIVDVVWCDAVVKYKLIVVFCGDLLFRKLCNLVDTG
jgi:hypothetical protein